MDFIVNLYLSVSNHFGNQHMNWFDFVVVVTIYSIIVPVILFNFNKPVNK